MKTIQEQNREVEYVLTRKELTTLLDLAGLYMTPEQWRASLPHYRGRPPALVVVPKKEKP